ncbi:hypothetical protein [uncultured Litoreibacter sp.]|uniref:hypothetical protein n=1 Tax=uncultured Litoreibacter sp. TaxID=1392394 RepID=UPI00263789B3|nr:hypothetical protein [uncultured Litoreibacter sp.]
MTLIIKTTLPSGALHAKYSDLPGHHADCYETEVEGPVTLPQFVEAFYTGSLFKCERVILKYTVKRPSTDADARAIALGTATNFAAWDMEARNDTQLLMNDMTGATKSWFMVEPLAGGSTRLRFGSVVTPNPDTGQLPRLVKPLMRFHDLYSKLLLKGAVRRLGQ